MSAVNKIFPTCCPLQRITALIVIVTTAAMIDVTLTQTWLMKVLYTVKNMITGRGTASQSVSRIRTKWKHGKINK